MEVFIAYRCNGIDLCGTSDSKGSKTAEECKDQTKPAHIQSTLQSIHGTTLHTAVFGFDTVFYGNERFAVFGGDSENTGKPAPENCAGTAKSNGGSHTDDISGSNGRSKCCGQSTKLADFTFCVGILGNRQADGSTDLSLDHTGTDGHKNMGAQKQNDHPPAPHQAVDLVYHISDCIHHRNLLPFSKRILQYSKKISEALRSAGMKKIPYAVMEKVIIGRLQK